MKKTGTLAFLAASLFAANLALANPLPAPSGGTLGSGGATSTGGSGSGSGGNTTIGIGGHGGSSTGTDASSDSGCSLAGSHLVRSLAPWSIAGAFSVTYFFVRRRSRR